MYDLIMREYQDKILAVGIKHTEGQFTVMLVAEIWIALHISGEIIHPAHIPFIVKAESVFLYGAGDLRPCGGLLCDQKASLYLFFEDAVQMLQKFYCFQVLVAAVDIRYPLTVILAVIQIQHGGYSIHADPVCMVLLCPKQCICDQEVCNLRPSVIVDQSAPVRMGTLPRILVFIYAGAVKAGQSMGIPRKMRRYPIQDHADPLLMHIVHEIHEIIRSSVAAGRRIISGHLISPGLIERMLHDRHQLHMGISHLFYVLCQLRSNLPVIVKFRPQNRFPVRVHL